MNSEPGTQNTEPTRVWLRRTRGYRMPENTVKVSRPSLFGNPFGIEAHDAAVLEATGRRPTLRESHEWVVAKFETWLDGGTIAGGERLIERRAKLLAELPKLRGKNLACFCPPDLPCHADVLLRWAAALPVPSSVLPGKDEVPGGAA